MCPISARCWSDRSSRPRRGPPGGAITRLTFADATAEGFVVALVRRVLVGEDRRVRDRTDQGRPRAERRDRPGRPAGVRAGREGALELAARETVGDLPQVVRRQPVGRVEGDLGGGGGRHRQRGVVPALGLAQVGCERVDGAPGPPSGGRPAPARGRRSWRSLDMIADQATRTPTVRMNIDTSSSTNVKPSSPVERSGSASAISRVVAPGRQRVDRPTSCWCRDGTVWWSRCRRQPVTWSP